MPALRSSVLIIHHPCPETVALGADFAVDFKAATAQIRDYAYQVVVFPSDSVDNDMALDFLDDLNEIAPLAQRVVVQNHATPEMLRQMINKGNVFKILQSFTDAQFERTLIEALEEHSLIRQNAKLLKLVNEQNENLKRFSIELEDRIERRQRFLDDSRKKLLGTNDRVEALHQALVAVHKAGSIPEMERLTNEALRSALGLSWIRILFRSQSAIRSDHEQTLVAIHSAPLWRGREQIGTVAFARNQNTPFSKDETAFLNQIADAVSLAIVRLSKLEQSESLKHQWEATFDAILDPVCLIDSNYTIQRINRAFAHRGATGPERLIGRKCYEALFARSRPCEGCKKGANFRLKPARTADGNNAVYDVFSQAIQFKPQATMLYVNMYHDMTSQLRLERQVLESAKMAELGVIGSSIAHELNNPLGGMLSFLQLIRMGLKGDEPYHEDILEMERGALRCREIVKNLLGFTRKSAGDDAVNFDLRDVTDQALKITELQTRAMGIAVETDFTQKPVMLNGQYNYLAQAIRNVLQNSQEAIAERLRKTPAKEGLITVQISNGGSENRLVIKDNGIGFDPTLKDQVFDPLYTTKDPSRNPGLGLTIASQIIRDHGGEMEISSHPGQGTEVKIRFPRSESSG